ncbi:MAG TPA: hypothetical protein VGK02_07930 [Candidatus Aquicultor sp.]|jgi:hypothetical protein
MRIFNRVLATIISIALMLGSAVGILYLIGRLIGVPALISPVTSLERSLLSLSPGAVQALLLGIFLVSLVLFVLEVRPFRAPYVVIRESDMGSTVVPRRDVERFLLDRLTKDMHKEAITPTDVELQVHGEAFDVATELEVPSIADRQAVRAEIENDIKTNLSSLGLDDELEQVRARISRIKRVA